MYGCTDVRTCHVYRARTGTRPRARSRFAVLPRAAPPRAFHVRRQEATCAVPRVSRATCRVCHVCRVSRVPRVAAHGAFDEACLPPSSLPSPCRQEASCRTAVLKRLGHIDAEGKGRCGGGAGGDGCLPAAREEMGGEWAGAETYQLGW